MDNGIRTAPWWADISPGCPGRRACDPFGQFHGGYVEMDGACGASFHSRPQFTGDVEHGRGFGGSERPQSRRTHAFCIVITT